MEKLAISKARDPRAKEAGTVICATRYGNVMCSRGSIIPLFIDQINAGQPMTVTVPEMTRFMMSLDEAVDLVLFSIRTRRARRLVRSESTRSDYRSFWHRLLRRYSESTTRSK